MQNAQDIGDFVKIAVKIAIFALVSNGVIAFLGYHNNIVSAMPDWSERQLAGTRR